MVILITGTSATGKSTLAGLLKAHGYPAIDIDGETDIAGSENIHTQQIEYVPSPRPHDWFFNHRWVWQGDKLQAYIKNFSKTNDLLILCGNSDNQASFYHLFDKLFVLTVDKPTLENRLLTRTNNSYGKLPHELTASLNHYDSFVEAALTHGAIAIDNTLSLSQVVNEITGYIHDSI